MKNEEFHRKRIERNHDALLLRRDCLVDQINHIFKGVRIEGGVTLSEAHAIDNYESDEDCATARLLDKDAHWSQVDVERMDPGGSCLSFVDPIGYRFYIPTYMIYTLQNAYALRPGEPLVDSNVFDHLLYELDSSGYETKEVRDNVRKKHSLLTHKERVCVARFLALDAELEIEYKYSISIQALKSDWEQYLPHSERKHLISIWPQAFD